MIRVNVFASKLPSTIRKSLLLKYGANLAAVPKSVLDELGYLPTDTPTPTKELDLNEGQPRIALDTDEAIKSIEEQGFYVSECEIKTTITVG